MMNTATKIKIGFLEKGISGVDIARQFSPPVDRTAVYHVIAGRSKSPRIRKAIADALGMKVKDLWPEERKAA
jgi:lambda repressor-like predicted transcriptional regulator